MVIAARRHRIEVIAMSNVADNFKQASAFEPRSGIGSFFAKIQSQKDVAVGYFGTSVTAGLWPGLVTKWFSNEYPRTDFREVNASIGGTASSLGVFRLEHDLLCHKPDLIFVEFCNDASAKVPEDVVKHMDGIMQKICRAGSDTAIVFVHTPNTAMLEDYNRGENPKHVRNHEYVADRYRIPSINIGCTIAERVRTGAMRWEDFADGRVHPHQQGHELFAQLVTDRIREMADVTWRQVRMPEPVPGSYDRARLVPLQEAESACDNVDRARHAWGKRSDSGELTREWPERVDYYGKWMKKLMPQVWTVDRPGDSVTHRFSGTCIGIYDLNGPDTGTIAVSVDGKGVGVFDRYVDAGKTIYRLSSGEIFCTDLDPRPHTVEITLLDGKNKEGQGPVFLPGFWLEA